MQEIVEFIKQQIDPLNVESMAADLSLAVSYYYTASTYYSEQEMAYNRHVGLLTDNLMKEDWTMKEKEFKIKQLASEYKFRMQRAEGIVKALEIKIESLRTLISKAKTEMTLSK